MKHLQNNFTTPEQSKRLLELGVPADSADCYYDGHMELVVRQRNDELLESFWDSNYDEELEDMQYIPCWSVGRLIEIIGICTSIDSFEVKCSNSICDIIRVIEHDITHEQELDFSKLED